ncbi:MAG: thioredoxin-like domain-containing protein [Gammaproteobacteria bacterium]
MSESPIRAPELPTKLEWFNTAQPVKLAEQRGKVVVLDFWTYCCINCVHVLADLRYLEEKYRDGLTVIGVHSPKFPRERVGRQVQKAINRYHIRHPVANDPELSLWRTYGIKAWPSLIVIGPEGYILGVLRGEGHRRKLDQLIGEQLEKAEEKGVRQRSPMPYRPAPEPPSTLSFPGKVLATPERLYISDSGRNRVVETNHFGRVLRIFGSGSPGLLDNTADSAAFNNPQGLALVDEFLYVADTDNHAIRRVRLRSGDVETIAGTGVQDRGGGTFFDDPTKASLNSPWDLAYDNGILYIAMAGRHQVWRLHLTNNTLGAYAGSGREGISDGPAAQASFAQPSGLAVADERLFVADAETSAIRQIRLPFNTVGTVVGTGLFEFGDTDGAGRAARLQHPLGIAVDAKRKRLWIADTYNCKIKTMRLKSNAISTFNIGYPLDEPAGLSVQGDLVFVANTNAHEIVRIDLAAKKVEAMEIVTLDD